MTPGRPQDSDPGRRRHDARIQGRAALWSFARELVALANTIGGKYPALGYATTAQWWVCRTRTISAPASRISPYTWDTPVHVIVEPIDKVLVVHVRESDAKPVQCSDGFFWRQGAVTQKLWRDEIRDFFRAEGAIRFDLSPCPRFRYPQDFDRQKYAAWLALSGISGRSRIEDVLVNIEAAERSGGKLLFRNGGVLFFAKDPRPNLYPGVYHLPAGPRHRQGAYPGSQGLRWRHRRRH